MIINDYLLLIAGMWMVTFLPRWVPLFFLSRLNLPEWFKEWLELIPVAILSAILLPALITKGTPRTFDFLSTEMIVAVPTFITAFVSRSLGVTILSGMFMFWLAEKLI